MSHRTVTKPAPEAERCKAILGYVHNWRCTRRASPRTGLCSQHGYLGATVPERWEHETNDLGVDVPTPIGSRRRIPGDFQARC